MPKQMTFASLAHTIRKKVTRRERLLAGMEAVVPWSRLLVLIEPHYPKMGRKGGRPVIPLDVMLRIYCLQQWYALSDPMQRKASTTVTPCAGLQGWNRVVTVSPTRPRSVSWQGMFTCPGRGPDRCLSAMQKIVPDTTVHCPLVECIAFDERDAPLPWSYPSCARCRCRHPPRHALSCRNTNHCPSSCCSYWGRACPPCSWSRTAHR